MARILALLVAAIACCPAVETALVVGTWNIEHLGSPGRGFGGGFGGGSLPARNSQQLTSIGHFIRDTLHADALALQEIGVSRVTMGTSESDELRDICNAMGPTWRYYVEPIADTAASGDEHNQHNAFIWNSATVRLLKAFPMAIPSISLRDAVTFKRQPLVAYFEALHQGAGTNDFILVNVHLPSGQDNDETQLISVVMLEHLLTEACTANGFRESDRIILGDFNHNPYAKNAQGKPLYTPALKQHLEFKQYTDLVTDGFHSTRMDENLKSIIDHIFVSSSGARHLPTNELSIYLPGDGDTSTFATWRKTYSDHFPLTFRVAIDDGDDDSDSP